MARRRVLRHGAPAFFVGVTRLGGRCSALERTVGAPAQRVARSRRATGLEEGWGPGGRSEAPGDEGATEEGAEWCVTTPGSDRHAPAEGRSSPQTRFRSRRRRAQAMTRPTPPVRALLHPARDEGGARHGAFRRVFSVRPSRGGARLRPVLRPFRTEWAEFGRNLMPLEASERPLSPRSPLEPVWLRRRGRVGRGACPRHTPRPLGRQSPRATVVSTATTLALSAQRSSNDTHPLREALGRRVPHPTVGEAQGRSARDQLDSGLRSPCMRSRNSRSHSAPRA